MGDFNQGKNVYPQINFLKYILQIMEKHRKVIIGAGLAAGLFFWSLSYFQVFTSSTVFRFQSASNSRPSTMMPFDMMGKTDSTRDKAFNYMNSVPFYLELAKKIAAHEKGKKYISIFSRSRDNFLIKLKGLFIESVSYGSAMDSNAELAQALQRIYSFKKEGDSAIVMLIKTGRPGLSVRLGEISAELVKDILIDSEAQEVKVSSTHIKELLEKGQANLKRIEANMLGHKHLKHYNKTPVGSPPLASLEMEKEIRLARIEAQRYELLISGIEKQISDNSRYDMNGGEYKYVDQNSLERLNDLKQQRDIAFAKVESLERTYDKFKVDNQNYPVEEQKFMNLRWMFELESAIVKDLLIKSREIEGTLKLLENSVRPVGSPMLVPSKMRLAKVMRLVLGFMLGSILAMVGLYYFFDFFKVIRGSHDLRNFGDFEIMTPLPQMKGSTRAKKFDVWKELPVNHHAMEAFRIMMERSETAKVISFISPHRGEGKSFIVANLAENLARFGKKVVVVDTNWTNPTLSNVLANNKKIRVVEARQFEHDSQTYLDRSLLIKQIKENCRDCDIILIDTQCLAESSDALVACSISNLTIVVSAFLETFHHRFYDTLKKLEVAGLNDYIVVLNKANLKSEIQPFRIVRAMDEITGNTIYLKKSS